MGGILSCGVSGVIASSLSLSLPSDPKGDYFACAFGKRPSARALMARGGGPSSPAVNRQLRTLVAGMGGPVSLRRELFDPIDLIESMANRSFAEPLVYLAFWGGGRARS